MSDSWRQSTWPRSMGRIALALTFVIVLGLPFALRPKAETVVEGRPSELETRKLVILSPHAESIQTEFERAFSQWTAETRGFAVEIEWLDQGGTIQAIKFVDDRFDANPEGIRVDIFFGGGSDPFLHFSKKGLLRRLSLPEEILSRIPRVHAGAELYDADLRWFGACLSGFGIIYNRAILEFLDLPLPKTWADLGRPEYFTWVTSADPRLSGSMHMAYEIILQAYGWEEGWAHALRIGANCRAFSRGASDVPIDVAAGEAACGMAIDTYGLRAVAEAGEDRMAFVLPRGLTVVNPDGIAILKGAPNAELAGLFVQFVLSERGQKLWMLRAGAPGGPRKHTLFRLPLIPGMVQRYRQDSAVRIDPFQFEAGIEFDLDKKNRRWGILNDLLGACMIDVHQELSRAWAQLRNLPSGDRRLRRLLEPPVSEDELLEMAGARWEDAEFRAETVASWSAAASQRYRRLARGEEW
ncbi:MAG: ABC transporter substrate-binding protein [Planctomycetota bacterium]|jgi:ABC-type Fe3+ transport system substrate-binding protein